MVNIAIRFKEYDSLADYVAQNGTNLDINDYETDEEYAEAIRQEIKKNNEIIDVDENKFIVESY